jgi:hypothetical protein
MEQGGEAKARQQSYASRQARGGSLSPWQHISVCHKRTKRVHPCLACSVLPGEVRDNEVKLKVRATNLNDLQGKEVLVYL